MQQIASSSMTVTEFEEAVELVYLAARPRFKCGPRPQEIDALKARAQQHIDDRTWIRALQGIIPDQYMLRHHGSIEIRRQDGPYNFDTLASIWVSDIGTRVSRIIVDHDKTTLYEGRKQLLFSREANLSNKKRRSYAAHIIGAYSTPYFGQHLVNQTAAIRRRVIVAKRNGVWRFTQQ